MRLSELKKRMKGVDVVQVTPFNTGGSLDLDGMWANTRGWLNMVQVKILLLRW